MKRAIFRAIRAFHLVFFDRGLPGRIGVYGHATGEDTWDETRSLVGFLHGEGYRFVGPDEFVGGPEKCAFLSYDDNFQSWYRALPLFDELQVPATFYVNSLPFRDRASDAEIGDYFDRIKHFEDRVSLSTEELREIAARGHTIGCHTHTHPVLARLPAPKARDEIRRSKEELEAILGQPVEHFSYPFGMRRHFNEELRAYCASLGLTVANAIIGMQHAGQQRDRIQRTRWDFERPVAYNAANLRVDGRLFERLTGRSSVI